MSRSKRRSYGRALGAAGAAAAVMIGSVVLLTVTAAGDTRDPREIRRAPVVVEPALVAASEAVQARAEQRMAVALLERIVAENAAKQAARDGLWDAIAACETEGNWSMRGSAFSGGLGFANSSWSAFGGQEFAPNAGQATREQQIIVAERIRAAVGLGAWGCAARVTTR